MNYDVDVFVDIFVDIFCWYLCCNTFSENIMKTNENLNKIRTFLTWN